MAVIPRGDFGFAIARPQPSPGAVQGAFDNGNADALARGARVLGDVADNKQTEIDRAQKIAEAEARQAAKEAEHERKAMAREADRVKSAVALRTVQNGMNDLHDELTRGLMEGTIPKDQVVAKWDEASQKLSTEALQGVAPEHRPLVEADMIGIRGRLKNTLGDAIYKRDQQEVGAGLIQLREATQRAALRDPTKAIADWDKTMDALGAQAGMNPEQIAKEKQGFREQVTFTGLDRAITAAQTNGAALKALSKDLAGDKFADLAPEKRNFFEAKIQRNLQHMAQMGEIAERRRLANVQAQATRLGWYVEHGKDIPPAEFDAFTKASKGTPFEGMAQSILAEQKAVSELASLPPEQMFAKVKAIEAGYGPTPSKEQLMHVDKLKRYAENTRKALIESPLMFAVERGGAKVQPLDLANMGTWEANLQQRTAILTEQSQRTGADPKALFPQEVQAFKSALDGAKVEQKRDILATLRKGLGDEKVYRATLQQIAPDDPVTQAAGIAAARGLTDNTGKVIADYILRGQMALRADRTKDGQPGKGGLLPMPKDEDLNRPFNDYTGNAFAGAEKSRSGFLQTAKAIYAARSLDEGDYSGELNGKRWQSAIELATGNVNTYKGRSVVLPYGMDAGKFRDEVRDRVTLLADKLPANMPLDRVRDIPLENAGDGRYIFRAGDGILVGKDGKPLVLDFNQPLPPEAVTMPKPPQNPSAMRKRMGGDNPRNRLE